MPLFFVNDIQLKMTFEKKVYFGYLKKSNYSERLNLSYSLPRNAVKWFD